MGQRKTCVRASTNIIISTDLGVLALVRVLCPAHVPAHVLDLVPDLCTQGSAMPVRSLFVERGVRS